VTHNAARAVKTFYDQVLGPKAVVAIGSCPASTNVFIDSRTLDGPLSRVIPVDVFVPGCPPSPSAIIAGIAKAASILAERAGKDPAPVTAPELATQPDATPATGEAHL
jgi:Ni,Fe-hydrogenase III small subunit